MKHALHRHLLRHMHVGNIFSTHGQNSNFIVGWRRLTGETGQTFGVNSIDEADATIHGTIPRNGKGIRIGQYAEVRAFKLCGFEAMASDV